MKKRTILFLLFLIYTGCHVSSQDKTLIYSHGAVTRTDTSQKQIHLVFTGDEYAEGGPVIREVLDKHGIKASFFLTGNFYRNPDNRPIIEGLLEDGHYLGAHSDRHLLYASWENRDSTLISREEFERDVLNNYKEMSRFGIQKEEAPYYLPPYEWYNEEIARWTRDLGLVLVNFSPGTYSNADYTIPGMGSRYLSSDTIFSRILHYEEEKGLNGFIMLLHIGVHPERPDPFYYELDSLIQVLKKRGYSFSLLDPAIPS
ncbi:MAG: Cellulase [Marinimicrobia bacterium 46_43]|nr:MAG: Cellulase [Marinimicrobia bacterium 46_43]